MSLRCTSGGGTDNCRNEGGGAEDDGADDGAADGGTDDGGADDVGSTSAGVRNERCTRQVIQFLDRTVRQISIARSLHRARGIFRSRSSQLHST